MDLVVSRSNGSGAIMTLTGRRSREKVIFKLPDKRAYIVRTVFDKLERKAPGFGQRFRTITTGRNFWNMTS